MPFTHAFHHLPSNAPIWQKALYGAGVFADVGMWALPATKLVAPAFKLGMESKLLSNVFKTTSLETKVASQSMIHAEKQGAKLVAERTVSNISKNQTSIPRTQVTKSFSNIKTDFIWSKVEINGKVQEGWINIRSTLNRIGSGVKNKHRNDGSVFKNTELLLPKRNLNYYK